ncbi:C4-dicarboxylate ABC transporter substrate-binding protein [Aquicoccus sp. SCR17]|nr:C4-dicarboxylate ABC transporter substrate-binding protein [Carideicomes alvinocaridis]
MGMQKLIGGAAIAALLALAAPVSAQVKIANDGPMDLEKNGTYNWTKAFQDHLEANGMEAEQYEVESLGGEEERLDQVSQGLLEVSMSAVKMAGQLDPTIYGVMLPFFFTGIEQQDHALFEGGMLEKINEQTTPKGVRVLDLPLVGTAAGIFNTKHPVATPEDMSDLRMRALDEIQIEMFEAWGSQGTIVAWSEVPNALQTGIADGYLNPPIAPLLFGHQSFIKYFTDARLVQSSRVALVSEDWYQSLSDEEKQVVQDAAKAGREANRAWLAKQDAVLSQLEEAGIEVSELSPEAKAEFARLSETTYGALPLSEEAIAEWEAAKGE